MCPYSALGVLSEERVSKRLTSFSRRLITSAGTSSGERRDRLDQAIGARSSPGSASGT